MGLVSVAAIIKTLQSAGRVNALVALPSVAHLQIVKLTLDVDVWLDPSISITFGLDQSLDNGISWTHWVSAIAIGGARSKAGALPTLQRLRDATIDPGLFRPFMLIGKSTTVGLLAEIL